ncbi:hypothetical protein ABH926_001186 [Catenulispora sp. GP43]|uniref:hypothetical protein n=1 Tax=Catenulispora sp. GP43 TaxID=3156263 RepID=UPI003518CA02
MGGLVFLIGWGVLVLGLGTVLAFNVGGAVDTMMELVGQTKLVASMPDGLGPFMTAVFPRLVGGFFMVAGTVAIGLGIAFL